ncbi:hypothetical protein [Algoriphagus aquimarinus]|uniref:Uncharacterized protein n=1 Tax=Algoriphagus aquimarinus TaxID=237018 RepID=A0A1I1ADT0_9BACT|nr:hypothetical protein [Algoriphagus aquimarinus]SFB36117.1 hypothetical protein SAMN04489723_10844 [Algoriphagus aquimarinus]
MINNKLYQIRANYQGKRKTVNWLKRKKRNKEKRIEKYHDLIKFKQKPYVIKEAPIDFDFINNTNEVLKYFNDCGDLFNKKEKVEFDISKIKKLTPDAISLLVASVNSKKFIKGGLYKGGAPEDPKLKDLFIKSGFYDFVNSRKKLLNPLDKDHVILHKERDYKVRPRIAKNACLHSLKFLKNASSPKPFEELYEIMIEAMQNTNNHASLKNIEKTKWWMYVYNDKENKVSKFCFFDLGVGIFESLVYQNYIKNLFLELNLISNSAFVKDLLNGRIQSRVDIDNSIRGKGIPQIVNNAQLDCFKKFILISNEVKIDLKNKTHVSLDYKFGGTFFYWELKL